MPAPAGRQAMFPFPSQPKFLSSGPSPWPSHLCPSRGDVNLSVERLFPIDLGHSLGFVLSFFHASILCINANSYYPRCSRGDSDSDDGSRDSSTSSTAMAAAAATTQW